MYLRHFVLVFCLTFGTSVYADAGDDCISEFQAMKVMYDTSSVNSQLNCIKTGNSLKVFATAAPPPGCHGEDEWHLEASAIAGKTGKCVMRLHGSPGEGCGMDKVEFELKANEAAAWRKFLDSHCEKGNLD
jgi:hypothetical protein